VQKCLSRGKISLLSTLIAKSPTVVENPFFDFAKWDGNVSRTQVANTNGLPTDVHFQFHPGSAVKNFRIFPLHADFPLNISVLSCAKIADLIGLCCYHYTADSRNPPLRYLHIRTDYDNDLVRRLTRVLISDTSRLSRINCSCVRTLVKSTTIYHHSTHTRLSANLVFPS